MKSFILVTLLCTILLCSCTSATDTEGMFDYQNSLSVVEGTLKCNGETYGVVLHFEISEKGENTLTSIEYTSPESLSGFVFEREGEEVTVKAGSISISGENFDCEKIFRAERMFSLSAEDIISITNNENGDTVAVGENGSYKWQAVTGEDGTPKELTVSDGTGEETFEITKLSHSNLSQDRK